MHGRQVLENTEAEDATLIALAHDIDQHTTRMRNAVLESIASIRHRVHAQAADVIQHERNATIETEQKLRRQVANLEDLLAEKEERLDRERALTDRLIFQRCRSKQHTRDMMFVRKCLRGWYDHVSTKKRAERLAKHLDNVRKDKEARHIFNAWRVEAMRQKFAISAEKAANDSRRHLAKLTSEHQTQLSATKMEVLSLNEKLQLEEERRGLLEEKLKAAFMRGVCALNLEAMQVLRHAGDADVSVATLLQGMNVTADSSSDLSNAQQTERLLHQQALLNEQLAQMTHQRKVQHEAEEAVERARQSTPQPTSKTHQPFSVTINPQYRSSRPGSAVSKKK